MPTGHERSIVPCLDWGWTPPQLVLGYWLACSSWDNHKCSESHAERLLFCWFPQLLLFEKRVFARMWTPAVRLLHWERRHMSLSCHPVFLNNYAPFSFLTLKPETVIPSSRAGLQGFQFRAGVEEEWACQSTLSGEQDKESGFLFG